MIKKKLNKVVGCALVAGTCFLTSVNGDEASDGKFDTAKFKLAGRALVGNGSFEKLYTEANLGHLAKYKKIYLGYPLYWYRKISEPEDGSSIEITDDAHSGRRAFIMKATGESAQLWTFSMGFKVGKSILCEAWVKNLSKAPEKTKVYILIKWYKKSGGWLHGVKTFRSQPAKQSGEWEKLSVVAEKPEGAGKAAIFIIAENVGTGDSVIIDNVKANEIIEKE